MTHQPWPEPENRLMQVVKALVGLFALGVLPYILTGCGPKRIEIQGWCRQEALYVGTLLNETYPGMAGIEWSKTGPMRYHVQAFARIKGIEKTYFTRWNNYAVRSERDEQHGTFYQDQTVYEFFMSQYYWWRY